MATQYCSTCLEIAAGWRHPGGPEGDPLTEVSRASAAALFGLHVASAHPEAEAPEPRDDCHDCRTWAAAVTDRGAEASAGCSGTVGELLQQHLLSHGVADVPDVPRTGG